jgi:hypothetical protein
MSWLLTNKERPYIEASKTNVLATFKLFGFIPPSEVKPVTIENHNKKEVKA